MPASPETPAGDPASSPDWRDQQVERSVELASTLAKQPELAYVSHDVTVSRIKRQVRVLRELAKPRTSLPSSDQGHAVFKIPGMRRLALRVHNLLSRPSRAVARATATALNEVVIALQAEKHPDD
jgi:hypothetical protein